MADRAVTPRKDAPPKECPGAPKRPELLPRGYVPPAVHAKKLDFDQVIVHPSKQK